VIAMPPRLRRTMRARGPELRLIRVRQAPR
jgi:hypothetical protein